MAALHQALQCLEPESWEDVPHSQDSLRDYMQELFKNSRLIVETIPEPPPPSSSNSHSSSSSSLGSSSSRISNSAARIETTDPQFLSLQKEWGKPIRINNPKDNPLEIEVYKLSGKDGKGSWFARRSVHEGLPFSRWRAKMQREIGETLRMREEEREEGKHPTASIRGIGADRRTEYIEVKDADNETVLGHVEVYCLSAQFPGPTSARDFVTLLITTDKGLEASGSERPPHSFMVVSKPCDHLEFPPRDGYVRGQYESVELIREVPSTRSSLSSSASAHGTDHLPNVEEEDSNIVEWIMVTRSDPGGNVPRWMVEKGTPKSIVADAAKFVNWLCKDDHISQAVEQGRDNEAQDNRKVVPSSGQASTVPGGNSHGKDPRSNTEDETYEDAPGEGDGDNNQQGGLVSSVGNMINSGLEMYAPQAVLNCIPGHSSQPSQSISRDVTTPVEVRDDCSIATDDTFASAESHRADSIVDERPASETPLAEESSASATPALAATPSGDKLSDTLSTASTKKKLTSREKKLMKLDCRKQKLEGRLAEIRSEVDLLDLPCRGQGPESHENRHSRTNSRINLDEATTASTGKSIPEKLELHKRASVLARDEVKLLKQLRKVESEEVKVAKKVEAHKQKKNRTNSEVEDLRREVKHLRHEVGNLRSERQKWIELIGKLQVENTRLANEQIRSSRDRHKAGYGTE